MAHEAVAGDNSVGAGNHLPDKALRVCVDDNFATLFAILFKCGLRQSFAGGHPLKVFIGNARTFLPARIKDGRFNIRHAGGVRVNFACDIKITLLRVSNHLDKTRGDEVAGALYMHNVAGSATNGRERNNLMYGRVNI